MNKLHMYDKDIFVSEELNAWLFPYRHDMDKAGKYVCEHIRERIVDIIPSKSDIIDLSYENSDNILSINVYDIENDISYIFNCVYMKNSLRYKTESEIRVESFINRFVGDDHCLYDKFNNGYCFHFANMLKTTFDRGGLCLTYPYSHFVWMDDDGLAYDINGVYVKEAHDDDIEYIPIDMMNKSDIDSFRHIDDYIN